MDHAKRGFDLKRFLTPPEALRRQTHEFLAGALGFGFLFIAVASIQYSEHIAPAVERLTESIPSNAMWNPRRETLG